MNHTSACRLVVCVALVTVEDLRMNYYHLLRTRSIARESLFVCAKAFSCYQNFCLLGSCLAFA